MTEPPMFTGLSTFPTVSDMEKWHEYDIYDWIRFLEQSLKNAEEALDKVTYSQLD